VITRSRSAGGGAACAPPPSPLRGPLAGALLALALAAPLAGCGESKEEQAKKTVCSARSDIEARVNTLKSLTPSVATLPQIKTEASAIVEDVKQIAGAEKDLEPARRSEVEQATHSFEQQVSSALSNLTSSLSLTNAEAQLKAALSQLEKSYAQALAPIDCG
jgi:hypothetical protein